MTTQQFFLSFFGYQSSTVEMRTDKLKCSTKSRTNSYTIQRIQRCQINQYHYTNQRVRIVAVSERFRLKDLQHILFEAHTHAQHNT